MKNIVNGIDMTEFQQFAEGVSQDPSISKARFNVETRWAGQTRSVSTIKSYELRGKNYERNFHIAADEPTEILGTNTAPNPQELLMAALNACMTVGYVAIAATKGVTILNHPLV
ncbi:OsmC family protein [Aeromonas caviae]